MSLDTTTRRLSKWLATIATTEENEIDCDAFCDVIEEVVEAAAAGKEVRALLPHLSVHLDHCPDCRDSYQTLLARTRELS